VRAFTQLLLVLYREAYNSAESNILASALHCIETNALVRVTALLTGNFLVASRQGSDTLLFKSTVQNG
jgi:hypothetical protein